MKSKEEIEKLALGKYPPHFFTNQVGGIDNASRERTAFKKGYTQCQEDMAIEIAELKIICQEYSKDVKALNDMLNSLNKQD